MVIAVEAATPRDRTGWAFAGAVLGLLAVTGVVAAAGGALIGGLRDQTDETAATPGGGAGASEVAAPPPPPAHLCLDDAAAREDEPVQQATAPPPYALPDGWLWHQDRAGFLLAVPAEWTRHTDGGTVCFRDPVELRAIAVDPAAEASAVPSMQWQAAERELVRAGALPGYQKISIGPVIRPGGAAEWEYAFDQAGGERLHARRLLINDSSNRAYSLSWLASDSRWAANEADQRAAFASFRLE